MEEQNFFNRLYSLSFVVERSKVLSRYWSETFIGKLLVGENRSKSPVTLLELLLGETNKDLVGKNEATNF